MKRIALFILALLLAFSLISCTPEEPEDDDPETGDSGISDVLPGADTPTEDYPW